MKYQRIFRIFVSSTFSDMKAERDALQERVFPQLREYCQQHSWQFQAVDLRWGVNDETGHDQQTMRLCLAEIERSQQVSPKLNFLILLGERYGWIPLPGHIEQSEFELLFGEVTEVAKQQLLKKWYRLDTNAVPATYVLQPREDEFKTWDAWSVVENQLRGILQQAATACGFDIDSHPQFFASATDQEIRHGALEQGIDPQAVIGVLRTINGLPATDQAAPYLDIDANGSIDQQARKQQLQVHANLKEKLPGQMRDLPAQYNAGNLDTAYITAVCEHVHTELQRVIDSEIAQTQAVDAEAVEIDFHAQFAEERGAILLGRDDILAAIRQHVTGDTTQPLVLHGLGGAGKSAVMARAISEAEKTVNPNTHIMYRFLGTSPGSSDVRGLVTSLCKQIGQARGDNTVPPVDINELNAYFHKLLTDTPSEQRLVVLLDALDQLADRDGALDLPWLPKQLPANVRIVVSVLDGTRPHYILSKILPPEFLLELPPLGEPSASAILDAWLQPVGRTLTPEQRQTLLYAHTIAGGLALYLKLAFEEALHWPSYVPAPQLPSTQEALVDRLFASLAEPRHHGPLLVERALAYLMAATDGLNDAEIVDVLSSDAEYFSAFEKSAHWPLTRPRLPDVIWSRLYFDLQPYLSERHTPGAITYAFYHRVLQERATATYLPAGTTNTQQRHAHLAEYFLKVSTNRDRKYTEIPRQCTLAHWWPLLLATLTDLAFLEGKAESGRTLELARDFAFALNKAAIPLPKIDAVPTTDPPAQFAHLCGINVQRRHVELLGEALRRDLGFLTQYPQSLFQQLYNLCYWYDSPEAAAHYEPDDKGQPVIPGAYENLDLHQLLTFWATDVDKRECNWLRSQRPPQIHLNTSLRMVLQHEDTVHYAAYSPDGQRIVSASYDKTVRIWDAHTGKLLHTLVGHEDGVISATYSPNGQRIVSASHDKTVRIWDGHTGELLHTLQGHENQLTSATYSPDGRRIVSASEGKTVWIWDAHAGALLYTLQGHIKQVNSATYSPDGQRIVSASLDGTVRIWDASTGELLHTLLGHESLVTSATYSPDGQRIVSAGDKIVGIWDANTGELLHTLLGQEDFVISATYSPDGQRIVIAEDETVGIWDANTGELLHTMLGHENQLTSATYSPDGRRIVSASEDKTVRIWDASTRELLYALQGHKKDVTSATYSPDGQRIVSTSTDKTVRIWNANTGKLLHTMQGHERSVESANYSPDGQRIVSVSYDFTVRIWHAYMGELLHTLQGHKNRVHPATYSPNGQRIVSASDDKTVRIWDANTGELLHILLGHENWVRSAIYSPDSQRIVSASLDGTVRIWDANTGELLHTPLDHEYSVESATYSPNGQRIVSTPDDKTVRIWDANTGELLHILLGHEDWVRSAIYSPDSQRIVSASYDGTVRIWDAHSGKLYNTILYAGAADLNGEDLLLAAGIQPNIKCPIYARPRSVSTVTIVEAIAMPYPQTLTFLPQPYDYYHTHPCAGGRYFCCYKKEGNTIDFYELHGTIPELTDADVLVFKPSEEVRDEPTINHNADVGQNSEISPIEPNTKVDVEIKQNDAQPPAPKSEPVAAILTKIIQLPPQPEAIPAPPPTPAPTPALSPEPILEITTATQLIKYTALTFITILWLVIISWLVAFYFPNNATQPATNVQPISTPAVEPPAEVIPTFTKAAMCQAAVRLLQNQGMTVNATHLNPEAATSTQEVDVLLETPSNLVAIDCRATWDFWSVSDYTRRIAKLKQHPQYALIPINGVIVGMEIQPPVAEYAMQKRLYVISPDAVGLTIRNPSGFVPHTW